MCLSSSRPRRHTRLGNFGIADDAGSVDVFTGKADVGGCGNAPLRNVGKLVAALAAVVRYVAPFVRRVVLVREADASRGRISKSKDPPESFADGPSILSRNSSVREMSAQDIRRLGLTSD